MNTHVEYRRHGHRPPHPVAATDPADQLDDPDSRLAHHRDPSLADGAPVRPPTAAGVAWVRPTDMAAYAAPILGRGIDLQADLIRRARRTPASTAQTLPRLMGHPASATPQPATTATAATAGPTRPPTPPKPPARSVAHTEGLSL